MYSLFVKHSHMNKSNKKTLPQVLNKISASHRKSNFSKLVLIEEKPEEAEEKIRHYDIECEVAQILANFMTMKLTPLYLKFMIGLKSCKQGGPKLHPKTRINKTSERKSQLKPQVWIRGNPEPQFNVKENELNWLNRKQTERQKPHREEQQVGMSKTEKRKLIILKMSRIQQELQSMLEEEKLNVRLPNLMGNGDQQMVGLSSRTTKCGLTTRIQPFY